MKKRKITKKSIALSAIVILICVTMLVGNTFAWFTDTASTSVNKIQAGTLDVDLEMATEWSEDGTVKTWESAEGKTLDFIKAPGHEDEDILWEPGCTYKIPQLRIVNNGDLAIKYKVVVSGINSNAKLNDVIEWTIEFNDTTYNSKDNNGNDTEFSLDVEASAILTISGHMDENAGNEYQDESISSVFVIVTATQNTKEYDSKDNRYDKDATYEEVKVVTPAELKDILENSSSENTVTLNTDYVVTDGWTTYIIDNTQTQAYNSRAARTSEDEDIEIIIDGNGHTIYGLTEPFVACGSNVDVTIRNLTISGAKIVGNDDESTNGLGTAAVVSYVTGGSDLKIENCHVVDSEITANDYDGYEIAAGGIVGYVATESTVTIHDSSVENCTITSDSEAAGILAFTRADYTEVYYCSVNGNTTITCTEDRSSVEEKVYGYLYSTYTDELNGEVKQGEYDKVTATDGSVSFKYVGSGYREWIYLDEDGNKAVDPEYWCGLGDYSPMKEYGTARAGIIIGALDLHQENIAGWGTNENLEIDINTYAVGQSYVRGNFADDTVTVINKNAVTYPYGSLFEYAGFSDALSDYYIGRQITGGIMSYMN